MLFSTKAEYGVRLMVELGRRTDGAEPDPAPVSLTAVAEAEGLPLSYLEHLVAKLRQAGLVSSVRGAHGGYRLAKPAAEIAMLDVVQALEGPIAPMECFHVDREGRVLCSHESDGDRGQRDGHCGGALAVAAAPQFDHQAHSVLGFGREQHR